MIFLKQILRFFDFIFYKTYRYYVNSGESDIPGTYALCVITLFPLLNISTLIFFSFDIFKVQNWNYDKVVLLLLFIFVLFLNYYRIYKNVGIRELLKKWDNADIKLKKKLNSFKLVYFIISIICLFLSIIY